ncbi:MAG: LysR family transcriptional regulator [Mesorhizobium sp.]|nr:MAG: LysR family transcriptional regulator [Mesorhizobium sp.]
MHAVGIGPQEFQKERERQVLKYSRQTNGPNIFRGLDTSLIGGLWFFTVVARRKGFGVAAPELYVTQGAVSQRIRDLERRLGAKLFVRIGRTVSLTAAGEELFGVINGSFHDIQTKIAAFAREQQQVGLVVSCTPSLAMEWLLPRLSSWYSTSSNIKVQIRAEYHRMNREIMLNENIDVAIRYDCENYDDLHVVDLMEEQIFPVCTSSYWNDNQQFCDVSALDRLTLLHDAEPWVGAEPDIEWRGWLGAQGAPKIDSGRGERYNLAQMATRAALLHEGLAMGRSILVADYLADGRLIRPFGPAATTGARYRLLTTVPADGAVALFASWLTDALKSSADSIFNDRAT